MRVSGAGGSIKSKWTRLSMPSFFSWSTTEPRFERRISGYVCACKSFLKACGKATKPQSWDPKKQKSGILDLLGIKTEALARTGSPGTTRSLLGTCTGDGRYKKRFHSNSRVIDLWLQMVCQTLEGIPCLNNNDNSIYHSPFAWRILGRRRRQLRRWSKTFQLCWLIRHTCAQGGRLGPWDQARAGRSFVASRAGATSRAGGT